MSEPVFKDDKDNKWYFWDENYAYAIGPFETERETIESFFQPLAQLPQDYGWIEGSDRFKEEELITNSGIVDSTKIDTIKDIQTVLSIGDSVRDVKVGDLVAITFKAYGESKYRKDSMKASMDEDYHNVIKLQDKGKKNGTAVLSMQVDDETVNLRTVTALQAQCLAAFLQKKNPRIILEGIEPSGSGTFQSISTRSVK